MSATVPPTGLWCARGNKADLLLRGPRVVDPAAGIDAVVDVLVQKGKVAAVGAGLVAPEGVRVIDASGMLALPGFVDLHTHLRTPGREDEEDLSTGTAAAAAGGYVAVFGMANTDPVTDTAAVFEALARRAAAEATVPVGFYAAVSKGLAGRELTEMHELAAAGAVGFSDDGMPITSAYLLRRALQYARPTGRFVAVHAEDRTLSGTGVMHEGEVSAQLGLGGVPSIAESTEVGRDVEIAGYEEARLHVCHVSTAAALAHVVRAKEAGVPVTAEVTPHHLTCTHELLRELDPNTKMNPPLREESDRRALVDALAGGQIDCVATDHAPHALQEKEVPLEEAPFGTIGLETAFAVLHERLVVPGALPLAALVERMSQAPARIARITVPSLAAGEQANLCLVDPRARWTVDRRTLHSRSQNSFLWGAPLGARVLLTVAAGRVAHDAVA